MACSAGLVASRNARSTPIDGRLADIGSSLGKRSDSAICRGRLRRSDRCRAPGAPDPYRAPIAQSGVDSRVSEGPSNAGLPRDPSVRYRRFADGYESRTGRPQPASS